MTQRPSFSACGWSLRAAEVRWRRQHLTAAILAATLLGLTPFASAQGGAPLTASEERVLTASDGAAGDNFGAAVSVSGSFAAVGAYAASSGTGAVYLLERNQGGADQWQVVRKITAPDGQTSDHFGFSVSLSGSLLAVGAPDRDEHGSDAGMVYVFERNLGGADQWGLLGKVTSADVSANDRFGYSVSLDLNLLAVGAYGEAPNGVNKGAAYVFHMNYGDGWFGQVARLLASDGAAGDQFGIAISLSGDRVVVGAHMDDNDHGDNAGAAYLFARDHGGYNQWGQVRKFTGESEDDHYGQAVAIFGSTILLGAPASTEGGAFGRAYVYERNQGGADAWNWVKTLIGGSALGCRFGGAVALSYERALVGAPMEAAGGPVGSGAVYVFGRDHGGWGNWGRLSELLASDRAANDYFGAAVALDGNVGVMGAHGDDPLGSGSGSARLFRWTGNRWYFEAKLTNHHPAFPRAADYFGSSVAFENGWLAVGAPRPLWWASHNLQGSPGAPTVTMFRRHPPGQVVPWGGGQNVIYDDVGEDDGFGTAVAISGDKLVVGAPQDEADNGYPRGMAYAFEQNQGGADAWGQVRRLNQHNRHNLEEVGKYVAIEGDTIVLGSSGAFVAEDIPAWYDPTEWFDFWDDVVAEGGNVYLYCRDAGGQSKAWDYLRRFELWSRDEPVALSGNTLAVGIPRDPFWDEQVRVYWRDSGGKDEWGRVDTPLAPVGTRSEGFAGSVALDGDTLAVGPYVQNAQDNPGALPEGDSVFIYKRNAGGADAWGLVREIQLGFTFGATGLGAALALSGDVLLVSAVGQSDKAGAVYVFERNTGGADRWGLVHQFVPPETWSEMWFGQSVALNHNVAAIGAPGYDVTPISATASLVEPHAGAVYVFHLANNDAPVMRNTPGTSAIYVGEDATPGSIAALKVSTLVQRADVADADGDACGIAVVAANNTGGQWQYSTDGVAWFDLRITTPDTARVLDPKAIIRFVPAPDFHGVVTPGITFRAWDQTLWGTGGSAYASRVGGNSPFSEETEVLLCEVSPSNDRPVLDPSGSPRLLDVYGNIFSEYNRGQSVSNLIQGLVSDVDGDTCGMAVGSVVNANGQWEFSLDNGVVWRPLAGVSSSSARLLGPAARVRFMPAQNYSGWVSNGLEFVAWDQTAGASGGLASVQVGTAFSAQASAASILVTPVVNHAPVLDMFGDPVFGTIARNATANAGTLVADLLQDWVEDVDGDTCGIALAQVDPTPGVWQFSLNDGASWTNVGTVSLDAALLLGPEARLRLVPALNYTGSILVAAIYRAWDQTSGIEGTKADTSAYGGNSAFSTGIEPAPITVSAEQNQAPVLASPATPFLTTIQEGETASSGDSVGTLLGTLVSDADGHVCGMAIYGQDSTSGAWECVLGKNLPWVPLGTVSPTAARLLAPTARVRFVPADGYTGIVTNGLSFRAWDRSSGTNGGVANLAANGGSTPFSAGTGSAGIKVSRINHAPLFSHVAALTLPPILENQFRSPGTNVSRILGSYVSDADGDECGIAVSTVNSAAGVWEYSNDRGRSWLQLELPRGLYSRLLGPDVYLRFIPDRDFVGTITNGLLVRAWDQTRGTDGGLATTFETGGETAFSRAEVWISQTVREANRIPTDLLISATAVLENQPVGTLVAQLSALDPNVSDTHTFAFVAGEGDEGNASFTISSNALRTAVVFDRETRSDYSIRIRARDNAGGLFTKVFTITIGDVPDVSPHEVTLDPARVRENEAAGTVVGQLTALDVDLGETHLFSLVAGEGDTDNGSFAIQGNTLVTTAPLDYETKPVCQIRVQADDGQNPPLARTFNIWVVNVEDNVPPQDLRLNSTCLLDDTPPNTAVARIGVLDPNPADTQTLSLVAGPGDADNSAFQIDGRILLTATTIDFDQQAMYQLRIQTGDGQGGLLQKSFEIVPASLLWREDFEQGLGEWTHGAEVGSDTWQLLEGVHGSPTHSLSAAGTADTSDASAISPWIAIPATAEQLRLEFQQQYEWDVPGSDPLDGGVLEYRRQGEGETWDDLLRGEAGHSVVAGGYRVAISVTNAHPFSGRALWSGSTSNRFVPAVVSLDAGPLAGQTVQFRWRQIATSGVTSGAWHLDDMRLAAVAPPDPSVVRVQELVWVGNQLQLTWTSLPGQTYVIEATTSLGSAWAPVMHPIPGQPGATRTTVTLDPAALPGHPQGVMFFRMHSP